MAEKRNIFLVGPMGAGKSTIGRQLAQQLNMDFVDSDAVIEERAGADISWIFDLEGEEGFRKREERIINELTQLQGVVLSTGGGAVMSKENRNYLSARGIVIYLETSVDKQYQRTQRDKKRPLLQGTDNPRQVLEDLAKVRNPLYEEIADITLPTDEQNAKVMVNQIVDLIDTEDVGAIQAKINECVEKDPGAFEEEAMVISVEGDDGDEDEGEEIKVVSAETALIEARMRNINTKIDMVGSIQRNLAGNYAGKVQGIMIGLAFSLVIGALFLGLI